MKKEYTPEQIATMCEPITNPIANWSCKEGPISYVIMFLAILITLVVLRILIKAIKS